MATTTTQGALTTPKTYGASKKTANEITDYISHYMGGAGGNDPGMIAKGMQDFGVNLDDIYAAGQERYGQQGTSRQAIGAYIQGSGNDYLKSQYANWGSPAVKTTDLPKVDNSGAGGGLTPPPATQPITPVTPPVTPPVIQPAAPPVQPAGITAADLKAAMGALTTAAGKPKAPVTYTPTDAAMVSKQLQTLLASDSPYIQRARAKAAEYSNSRGLMNSSIGAGAGEAAAIDAGTSIAAADAATHAGAQQSNVNAQNQFIDAENNFGRTGALTAFGTLSQSADAAANRTWQSGENQLGRTFTAGENQANRTFQTGERVGSQNWQSSENALGRQFQTGERVGSQEFTAGENAANRNLQTTLQNNSQAFQSGENALGRALTTSENALGRASALDLQLGAQTFTAGENALNRQANQTLQDDSQVFTSAERVAAQNYTTARDSTTFANTLLQISASVDGQIRAATAQLGPANYASYQSASTAIVNDYSSEAQRIAESDMDPDVKASALTNLQNLTVGKQNFLNTVYTNGPNWKADWATFKTSFGGP